MFKGLLIAASVTLFAIAPMAARAEGQFFLGASGGPSRTSLKGVTKHLTDNNSYYVHSSSSEVDKKDSAYSFTAGYRWMIGRSFAIGLEGGLVDLGEITGRVNTTYPRLYNEEERGSIHTHGKIAGINAKWNMTYHWTLGVRAGYLHTSAHTKESYDITYVPPLAGRRSGDGDDTTKHDGGYAAAKIGYDFTPFFGIGVGYEYYRLGYRGDLGTSKQTVGVVSASAEIRF